MINLKKIRWKNFLSTGNVYSEIDFTESKLNLIVGKNGAGKTTVIDALTFGLFGKPFRKIKLEQLINTSNKKDLSVEVLFSRGTDSYKIVRGMRRKSQNFFEIYKNGTLIDQNSSSKDYQNYLETQVLRCNYRSFTQIIILGGSLFVPFMLFTPQQRREMVDEILDLKVFSSMSALHKDNMSKNTQEISRIQQDITNYEQKAILKKEKISFLEEQKEAEKKRKEQEAQRKEQEMERKKEELAKKKKETENLQTQVSELRSLIDDNRNLIEQYREQLKGKETNAENIRENDLVTRELMQKVKDVTKTLEFYRDTNVCPVCMQEITEAFKKEQISENEKTLQEVQHGLGELNRDWESENEKKKAYDVIEEKLNTAMNKLNKDNGQVEALEKMLQKSLVENTSNNEVESEPEKETTNYDEQIEQVSSELADIVLEISRLEKDSETHEKKIALYEASTQMLKDGGIKAEIISQYTSAMNNLISRYLAIMDFPVVFEFDSNFDEKICSFDRENFTYNSFSEGEKKRIDLAILMMWRSISQMKSNCHIDLLLMDELGDSSLDFEGVNNMMKILESMNEDANVFVISHRDEMQEFFERMIRFEKIGGFSKVVV